jgi:hypothetical protein
MPQSIYYHLNCTFIPTSITTDSFCLCCISYKFFFSGFFHLDSACAIHSCCAVVCLLVILVYGICSPVDGLLSCLQVWGYYEWCCYKYSFMCLSAGSHTHRGGERESERERERKRKKRSWWVTGWVNDSWGKWTWSPCTDTFDVSDVKCLWSHSVWAPGKQGSAKRVWLRFGSNSQQDLKASKRLI